MGWLSDQAKSFTSTVVDVFTDPIALITAPITSVGTVAATILAPQVIDNPFINPVGAGVEAVTGIEPIEQLGAGAVIGGSIVAAPYVAAGVEALQYGGTVVAETAIPAVIPESVADKIKDEATSFVKDKLSPPTTNNTSINVTAPAAATPIAAPAAKPNDNTPLILLGGAALLLKGLL